MGRTTTHSSGNKLNSYLVFFHIVAFSCLFGLVVGTPALWAQDTRAAAPVIDAEDMDFLDTEEDIFGFAAPAVGGKTVPAVPAEPVIKDIFQFNIPADWGKVKEVHKADPEKVIVYIQDAHGNYDCQRNIMNILDRLVQEYGVTIAGIEGEWARVPTEDFESFPDDDIRYQATDIFMRESRMAGPEALVISRGTEYPLELFGIDDQKLYEETMKQYKTSLPFKNETKLHFLMLNSAIARLKPHLYNERLLFLDAEKIRFEKEKISLNDYCLFMEEQMKDAGIQKDSYPNFRRYRTVLDMEKSIDFTKAERERGELMSAVSGAAAPEDMQALFDKGELVRNGTLPVAAFLSEMYALAAKNNLDLAGYPNLKAYIDYSQEYDGIQDAELFSELDDVDAALRQKVYENAEQKELDILARGLKVMDRMIEIKMVNRDLAFYNQYKDDLKTERFLSFLREQLARFSITFDLSTDITYLDVYIPAWVDFYRVASERDDAMTENTIRLLAEKKQKAIALVTGGFHTRQMTALFRQRGVSYLVITPRITTNEGNRYFQLMRGEKSRLDEFLEKLPKGTAR
ncbi:MAG: hypothetical protein NC924_09485 [Candidatus Omnitrophica bacterium]|nr:hypothetical protein [Candidatus Omnitrophota bacterium]